MAREIVDQAFDAGRDAVRVLVAAQSERIGVLETEIEELKRLIGRSSNNSSMPPSTGLAAGARASVEEEALVGKQEGWAARSSGPSSKDGRRSGSCR